MVNSIDQIRREKGVKCINVAFIFDNTFFCDNKQKQDPDTCKCRKEKCDLWGSW